MLYRFSPQIYTFSGQLPNIYSIFAPDLTFFLGFLHIYPYGIQGLIFLLTYLLTPRGKIRTDLNAETRPFFG